MARTSILNLRGTEIEIGFDSRGRLWYADSGTQKSIGCLDQEINDLIHEGAKDTCAVYRDQKIEIWQHVDGTVRYELETGEVHRELEVAMDAAEELASSRYRKGIGDEV